VADWGVVEKADSGELAEALEEGLVEVSKQAAYRE
jgi:hypothetical protein